MMSVLKKCTVKLVQAAEQRRTPSKGNGRLDGKDQEEEDVLSEEELTECIQEIMSNSAPDAAVASFLVALRTHKPGPPSASTLAAFAATLLDLAVPCMPQLPASLPPPTSAAEPGKQQQQQRDTAQAQASATSLPASSPQPVQAPLVDIVGTGGDGRDAFNVSTAAGLVMAACGLTVAKHGNRSSSGKIGSADFLEALGAHLQLSGPEIEQCIERCGFGFLFAQQFHPAMKHVAAIRKQLGIHTVFNLLGPLSNPAHPTHKVIGVSDPALGPVFARLLQRDGTRHALVVHSTDGLDEISPSAPSLVWEVRAGEPSISHYTVEPSKHFGCEPCDLALVCDATMEERLSAFRAVLDGDTASPIAHFVISNAAAGLYAADAAPTLRAAADQVRAVLAAGGARVLVNTYVNITHELRAAQPATPTAATATASTAPPPAAAPRAGATHTSKGHPHDDNGREQQPAYPRSAASAKGQRSNEGQQEGHGGSEEDQEGGPPATNGYGRMDSNHTYTTDGGIRVVRTCTRVKEVEKHVRALASVLDSHLGLLMCSDYEQPGRYAKWVTGFSDPPLMLVTRGRTFTITALNARGEVLLLPIASCLRKDRMAVASVEATRDVITGTVHSAGRRFPEEQRSRQPSVFSVVRNILSLFHSSEDNTLGLYGAFGYDLAFQFADTELRLERPPNQRDMVLFLPDRVLRYDAATMRGHVYSYDFVCGSDGTVGLDRFGPRFTYSGASPAAAAAKGSTDGGPGDGEGASIITCDHLPGQYADKVRLAKEKFKVGDLFETVLSQSFHAPCPSRPSRLFHRLRRRNPAPYAFIVSLGSKEYLVGASPEMYVRAQTTPAPAEGGTSGGTRGKRTRIETCPISGTIRRGKDPMEDSRNIVTLLSSEKEEAELTMCTDVDRNDKSRICVPGSVRLLARRQIELYSKLIHTVDHVEGLLRPGYDALDAFLCHTWAVTVTGAPKTWAMQFVEDTEATARRWYAGAVGMVYFNGDMNTGLTLRTIHIDDGVACVRAGATLLWDSDPDSEEAETRLKASAFLDALLHSHARAGQRQAKKGRRKKGTAKAASTRAVGAVDIDLADDSSKGQSDAYDGDGGVGGSGNDDESFDDDNVYEDHESDSVDTEEDDDDDDDDSDDSEEEDGDGGLFALSRQSPDPFTHGKGLKVVVLDHEDSFVHTLANYLRQTGAEVVTFRTGLDLALLDTERPDAVLMSPGPGCPRDFRTSDTLMHLLHRNIPVFGVCLGLQAMVEHFGGALDVLPEPLHGKPSRVSIVTPDSRVFADLDSPLVVARYHSLYARLESVPACLAVTAISEDGVVMAVEHKTLPLAGVQFHPESILTGRETGVRILDNALRWFADVKRTPSHPSTPSRGPRISSTI